MNTWKDDEQFIKDLKIISTVDGRDWRKELLEHQKEKPRATSRVTDITQFPDTRNTTQIPSPRQFSNSGIFTIIPALAIIIPFVISIYMYVKRKCHPQGDRNLQLPMDCPINCYKPQRQERTMEPNGEFPNQATKMLSQEDEPKTCE
ncbi:hypothetical protein LEMLEM_LOCUS20064 [Lemmus lemmus]